MPALRKELPDERVDFNKSSQEFQDSSGGNKFRKIWIGGLSARMSLTTTSQTGNPPQQVGTAEPVGVECLTRRGGALDHFMNRFQHVLQEKSAVIQERSVRIETDDSDVMGTISAADRQFLLAFLSESFSCDHVNPGLSAPCSQGYPHIASFYCEAIGVPIDAQGQGPSVRVRHRA